MLAVAVIGKGSRCPPEVRELAHQAGSHLARLTPSIVLLTGGLDGVMDAAARGFTAGGGLAIGLLPATARAPSKHHTFLLRTGLPENHRNVLTADAADLGVVLPGSHGTMVEGWVMSDRGVILIAVGDHSGWPTADLGYTNHAAPPELPGMVAGYLGLDRAGVA